MQTFFGRANPPPLVLRNARVVEQEGDGSCLYHSIRESASSLLGWNMPPVEQMRREVAAEVRNNGTIWLSFSRTEADPEIFRDQVEAYATDIESGGWMDDVRTNVQETMFF